ncbi:MAG: T9SS type A sorting domain-containing protein [Candidatus Aegiribacteria sp.]|nr:T9SS type A sorting domain-containing protein [Candidatus Aegiribacteria sp.]
MTSILIFLLCISTADPWADGSPDVMYGEGAGFGQEYYPENILGPPDPDATTTFPACSESELLTLGTNGWVVLEFIDNIILDGAGPDFSVFENVFQFGTIYFRECAFVEVSQDGFCWVMFPWDAESLEGLAGVWPTTGDDPTDPDVSGGDQFDLADIGLSWIKYVRLTDCGDEVQDGGLFDLDAVVAVNWQETEGFNRNDLGCYPNPVNDCLSVQVWVSGTVRLYSLNGRLIYADQIPEGVSEIEMTGFNQGIYLLRFSSSTGDNSILFTVAR